MRPVRPEVHLHLRPAALHARDPARGVRRQLRHAPHRVHPHRDRRRRGVPASWTYIAEQAPADKRAAHVGTAQLAWSIGPMVGFALAIAAAPLGLLGNRLIFAHLFVVAAIVWWLRRGLPESAIWKDERAATGTANFFHGITQLFSRRKNLTAMLFLFGVYALWNTVAGQAGIFQPRVYSATGVTSVTEQYGLQILVWGCTVAATYFGFMRFADRMSRRLLYAIGALLAIVAWAVLIYAPANLGTLLFFAIAWASRPASVRRPSTACGRLSSSPRATAPAHRASSSWRPASWSVC
ncbi:MFS transporter [Curtobacterium flaccumfaciens]|nr:MFS transporter [Curtobacterium flaccumfaciens]